MRRYSVRGFGFKGSLAAPTLITLALLLLPIALPSHRDLALLSFVAIFAIVAYSINVSFRYAGVLMIAQGAVWGVGAYTAGLLRNNFGWSFWQTLPASALLSALAAVIIGAVSLRSRGHYFLVVTFAINEFIVLAANQVAFTGGRGGLQVLARPDPLGPLTFGSPESRYRLFVGFLFLLLCAYTSIAQTRFGRGLIAVRENEDLARSLGVSILKAKLQVLALGGAMAGIAGVLYLYHQRAIQPDLFSGILFLQIILMVIIGGANTTSGPLVGALLMLLLPEKLGLSPVAQQITYGALLIGIILLAPQGVVGTVASWSKRKRSPAGELDGPAPRARKPVPGEESGLSWGRDEL